jgi:hypothetical protein
MKTPQELEREAEQRKRNSLIATGIPAHQVDGAKVHDFDLNVRHIRRPVQDIVDRWLKEGGPGFDEPQARAIEHVRELWAAVGSAKLVANLHWIGPGGGPEGGWRQAEALAQLAGYRREFLGYWDVFENLARWNIPATVAGEHLASDKNRRLEQCRHVVGMIASVIAHQQRY